MKLNLNEEAQLSTTQMVRIETAKEKSVILLMSNHDENGSKFDIFKLFILTGNCLIILS